MKFIKTKLDGAFIVEPELAKDERGLFARLWCQKEFSNNGLNPNLAQISIAFNHKKGTIRGMHFQVSPNEEAKLVRCTSGAIYDVIIDLRPASKTYKQWFSTEIVAESYKMIYVPEGFAHGYQTLEDNTEVVYHMSQFFSPEHYSGVRWNDPVFKIKWPSPENVIISDKDKNHPNFQ